MSFHSIESVVREQYFQSYCRMRQRFEISQSNCKCQEQHRFPDFEQNVFPFPHEKVIRSAFISYSFMFDNIFYNDMITRTSDCISCDHTFKSAANIGFNRKNDGKWIKVRKCLFCVLGKGSKILHWRFTRGESFHEVSGMFEELKNRYENACTTLQGIIIDNCCKWKGLFRRNC